MPDPVSVGIGVGGTVLSSAIGAKGASSAAGKAAGAADRAAQLQYEQYLQTRQDLQPYREVATGKETPTYDDQAYQSAMDAWRARRSGGSLSAGLSQPPSREDFISGYEYGGGALQELAGWGPSQVDEGDYVPPSAIPEFDATQFDIYKDPSYEWRLGEQNRAINRNMAGMGKVTSGNRLEEIMKRSGEMASQEYAAGFGRMIDDYNIRRANEATGYARGIDSYGRAVGREGDYLNRLASLSSVGQTATTSGAGYGATAAANMGNAAIASGQAQAAGRLGQANALAGGIGDLTSLYAMSQFGPSPYAPPRVTTDYSIPMISRSY